MPCSWCYKHNLSCRTGPDSSRCAVCIKRGRSCDGLATSSTITRYSTVVEDLKRQEDQAEAKLSELQEQLAAAVARLSRLRKTRKATEDRMNQLFARSMAELDEEDNCLPPETVQTRIINDRAEWGPPDEIDWSKYGFDTGSSPEFPVYPPKSPLPCDSSQPGSPGL
ncbi:hypothetical protein VDBG_10124 [Verticillium alfalfae VaMs.102]|uniref:Zn(2)-C6 fungal-type domain-containing protein n=2 Tax=Verticillium TaxID=1036719 RepID=G2X4V5_VERDV|nr:hypothetical protein VDBG_10124 [Verticillium alfalfae VaMs.102]XP_009653218.1 uncharacterized protein VDAG_05187 [Verticillium dahliae VdLs.17]EEY24014.1 hypothetical protein VDBG_10124 [Verticillium alfalfae VaMs.102]EGY23749.1 hypothetical protein VDAG_05187 [Verticillium dahliae VdLs.17]